MEQRVAGLLDETRGRQTILSKRGWALVLGSMLGLLTAICISTVTIAQNQTTSRETIATAEEPSSPKTVGGVALGKEKNSNTGAKIWLAVTSHEFNSEANQDNRQGLLRVLGSTDRRGQFG